MERELLQKKKESLISLKNGLETNKESVINIEKENEQLTEEYTNIAAELDKLDKIVFRYENLELAKKIARVCFVIAIVGGIVVGSVAHFASALNITNSIVISLVTTIASCGFGTFPYLCTKQGIKDNTNLTLEEVQKQIEELKENKKLNREKYKKNIKNIESIKFKNSLLESNLDALMQSLLKDKEARDEIMDQIMENPPSKELIEIVANNIVETSKIKTKALNK